MRFILLLAAWGTVASVPAWLMSQPWQRAVAAIAVRIVGLFGTEIEIVDLDLFFPYDVAIFAALCLASTWAPWKRRLRTIATGIPIVVALEVLSVVIALSGMASVATAPDATAIAVQEAQRFAIGVIRVTGLVAAAAVWFYFVGRERLSLAARTWLGA